MNNMKTTNKFLRQAQAGQSMVEYALILVMLMGAFIMAWTLAGPAIGNVFSGTVYDLMGHTPDLRIEAKPDDFWLLVTQIRANPPNSENTLPPSVPISIPRRYM